jgi:opacity protein-like surface antigen
MGIARTVAAVGMAVLASSTVSRAADMPEIVQQPSLALQQLGSSWYLRGDIAYRFDQTASGAAWNGLATDDRGLANTYAFGGGVGVKMGWLRLDATADYAFQSSFQGNVPGAAALTTRIDSLVLLANAYADLGTWHGLTPYVGAGVGSALVRTSGVTNTFVQPPAAMAGADKWNLAWALMAGVGYNVAPNVLIDIGYRYVHLGDVGSGMDQFGAALAVRGLSANEVRVGVRYTIE